MNPTLKNYQRAALAALESFFSRARTASGPQNIASAFVAAREEVLGNNQSYPPYRPFPEAAATPQICMRLPTGGGKTLLAAHCIDRAARLYAGTSYPVVLWLVPTNTIRRQTFDALTKVDHSYRDALLQYFPADRLLVLDIADCEQLRPDDFGRCAIVIVATIQTLRVENTSSRDVYAYKEVLQPHFASLPDCDFFEKISEEDLIAQPYLKPSDVGRTKHSLANLLAFFRPIVIVDEAHNSRTPLSHEALARVRPACIVEWTATPAEDQNVLFRVSAQELKLEGMIKLPIVLSPHPNWQEAVRDAVLTRDRLAAEARSEADYIRPIVLLQADAKDGDIPVARLRSHLIDTHRIDPKRIAIATGTQRELDGLNLFDPACTIDFVITVEALKEGWDCSLAYVFVTVQRIRSARDMEQLLGRVLRLPYATRRRSEHLNRAYAHVSAPATVETANELADRLISMGFEAYEATTAVESPTLGLFDSPPQPEVRGATVESELPVAPAAADALMRIAGNSASVTGGVTPLHAAAAVTVLIKGILPTEAISAAVAATPARDREELERAFQHHQARALKAASPYARGVALRAVPRFSIQLQDEIVLLEPSVLGELTKFSLSGKDTEVPAFHPGPDAPGYLIDVDQRVRIELEQARSQLNLNIATEGVTREDIIVTLDRKLRRPDVMQPDMIGWLSQAINGFLRRGVTLTDIARHINAAADAIKAKIEALAQQARREAFQETMFGSRQRPRLDRGYEFRFPPNVYPAREFYNGKYTFSKHYYGPPGELDSNILAEETACAIAIDQLPAVDYWIRNLERRGEASFAIPTSTDNFYPDFVVFLKDGRILVGEYKGADRYSNNDSTEKRDLGRIWAAASAGNCLFEMVTSPSIAGGRSMTKQLQDAIDAFRS